MAWHLPKTASNTFFLSCANSITKGLPILKINVYIKILNLPALNQGEDNPSFGNGSVLTFCCIDDNDIGKVDEDIAILPSLDEGPSLLAPPVVMVPISSVPPFLCILCGPNSPVEVDRV